MSSLLLLAVLLTLLSFSCTTVAYSPTRCTPATYTDPYPTVPSQVATSTTSHFYAVSSPTLSTITIHTATPATYNSTSSTTYTSVPSPCFGGSVDGSTVTFSPDYGRAIDLQANVLAIGAPSRSGTDGSFIDLVSLSVDASGSIVTANQTIYSINATLGLTLSLSSDASYLAAYYDSEQLVVYHPVLDRFDPQYNTASELDLLVPYPSAFYVDSILLSLPQLLVTGVMADSGFALIPTLLVYEGIGYPGNVTEWRWMFTQPLSAVAATVPLGYPARSLPLAASVLPGNSAMVAVGCSSQQTVYVTTTGSVCRRFAAERSSQLVCYHIRYGRSSECG